MKENSIKEKQERFQKAVLAVNNDIQIIDLHWQLYRFVQTRKTIVVINKEGSLQNTYSDEDTETMKLINQRIKSRMDQIFSFYNLKVVHI